MSAINQLSSIFQEVFDDPALVLRPETSPKDIADWDSVAQVKLVLAIEETFGIRFSTEEVTGLHCVGDFVAALRKLKGTIA
ncbi:MAG: acyl carrier protein [Acidobacteriales bacterium]|nr:acyl carrier protein [Terriglobales bacterium]